MYLVGDKVSYTYNGLSGIVTDVIDDERCTVVWKTLDGRNISTVVNVSQIELISGGSADIAAAARAAALSELAAV